MKIQSKNNGFTIVELLIVVVVIAILAAITIVAFGGITSQAREATLKSDLSSAAKQLGMEKVSYDSYPSSGDALKASTGTVFSYNSTTNSYCLAATSSKLPGKSFFVTEQGQVKEGSCPTLVAMQDFAQASCNALAVYNGSNSEAIQTLQDTRDNRTYEVARLADGKCWMIQNLRLGSTSSTMLLTPQDTNVASNFTLPQLIAVGQYENNSPVAYGPVPGDTSSGAGNYGYLYNWPAATAGETLATKPAGSADAAYSICAKGWRLPSGGASSDFTMLNAKMNNPAAAGPSLGSGDGFYQNWQPSGPFKGAFAGYITDGQGFVTQGVNATLWSKSITNSGQGRPYTAIFESQGVDVGYYQDRHLGASVRCVLN